MTTRRPTLLETLALASPFRGRTEDIAVEALGHILSASAAARAALSDIVDAGGAQVGPIARVRTQVTGEKGARPDLAGFDESGLERVLIEAKFAAGLTPKQPIAYLERLQRLPDGRPTALLFVSPTARVESLWAELRHRAATAGIVLESFRKAAGVRSALTGGGSRLLLASWTDLLDRMRDRVAIAADSQAESDIQQLRGLAEREDEDVFRLVHPDELRDQASPILVLLLRGVIDVAIERAARQRVITKPRKKSQRWGYGHWLRLYRRDVWFGIHFDHWVRSPTALLWLWFRKESLEARRETRIALEPLRSKKPQELFDDDEGGLLVSVPLPLKVESDALRQTVTALRDSIAAGAAIGDAEQQKIDTMLEPVLNAMVARLEEVSQLLGATSRRRSTKRNGSVARTRRPGGISAAATAGMREDFPRRVGSLRRLVDDATDRGRGERWADTSGVRATVQQSGYGRYLRLGRVARVQAWFGIQFWCWVFLQPPPTPLWLSFTANSLGQRETRAALEPLRGKNPSELIDDGAGGAWVPVPLPVGKEYDAVLEVVAERLEEVARLLDGP